MLRNLLVLLILVVHFVNGYSIFGNLTLFIFNRYIEYRAELKGVGLHHQSRI